MAVGKGSMARAAKATANAKTAASEKAEASAKETAPAKKAQAKTVAAAKTIPAPDEAVLQQIIYQTSSGMLERDAVSNEIFGLGDAMPVYYF